MFLPSFTGNTLDDLNTAFAAWLDDVYHPRKHSSTGQSPFDRFTKNLRCLRSAPADLMDYFRTVVRRKVNKDRTVVLNGNLFEAPVSLIGQRVELLYHDSDPGADPKHRWGRCPGFFNKKDKYQTPSGHYPLAKMIWVDWVNVAHIPPMLKTNPMKISTSGCSISNITFQNNSIRRIHYERGNESITDFAYALALARRGFSKQQIIERILAERTDWKNHTGDLRKMRYLDRTVSKALNIIASCTISY